MLALPPAGTVLRATILRCFFRLAHLSIGCAEALLSRCVLLRASSIFLDFLEVVDRVGVFLLIELAQLALAVGATQRVFANQVGIGHRQHAVGEAVDRLIQQFLGLLGVIVENRGRRRE